MKSRDENKQLRELDADGLQTRLADTEKELMNLHFKAASNQLQQTSQLTALRRRIARIKTIQAASRAAQ